MSNVFCLVASLFLLVSCSRAAPGQKTISQPCTREKRDAGLFPFPRVGRTSFPFTWSFLPLIDPESGERQIKREQLIPFPRVGKSGPKRNGASGNGGLWFGPRLGRLNKRMELIPVAYRQENNVPETLLKSVLKNSPLKGAGNSNDVDDYIDGKQ
uniref:CAPA n=1 Tax=Halyomorpha halys TaxID=286706 RepID=A0A3G3E5T1_HALHY|nr:CAPA [Halyomorpha halys]